MSPSRTLVATLLLAGCAGAERAPRLFNVVAFQAPVAEIYSGRFSGVVADGSTEEDRNRDPCPFVDQAFEVTLTVGKGYCIERGMFRDTINSQCMVGERAYYPLEGSLQLDGEPYVGLSGYATVYRDLWSSDAYEEEIHIGSGLMLEVEVYLRETFFARLTGDVQYSGEVESAEIEFFEWFRDDYDDDCEDCNVEHCLLPVGERGL